MSSLGSLFTRSGFFRAFRHRTFAIYISAHALSVVGLWIQRIAMQWLVWTLTGSYAWLGGAALTEALASMFFSLAAGPLVDRVDRVKLALLTQGLLMLLAVGLAAIVYYDQATLGILLAFVFLVGMLEGVWAPVRLSVMPNMVPKADMPAAIGITSTMFTLATFIGPSVGAIVVAQFDIKGAFIANAISYMGLLLVFAFLKVPRQAIGNKRSGFVDEFLIGIRFIAGHASFRKLVIFAIAFSLLIRPYRELFAGVADEVFNRGPEGLAALASASGFGAMIGAIAISIYGRNRGLTNTLYWLSFISLVVLAVFAESTSFYLSLAMVAALSACVTVIGTGAQMLMQMNVEDALRGRVMSVWHAQFRGIPPIGAWLCGILEPVFGLQWVLLGATAFFLAFLVVILPWRPALKAMETSE